MFRFQKKGPTCGDSREKFFPPVLRFDVTSAVIGNTFRRYFALRDYPPSTQATALLGSLSERRGVTLRLYAHRLNALEENRILQAGERRNSLRRQSGNLKEAVSGGENSREVGELLTELRREREPLFATSVVLEMTARTEEELETLSEEVRQEMQREGIHCDALFLRQKEGFLSVSPLGSNRFGKEFDRVLPASSLANLYPLQYSGMRDPCGLKIGTDPSGAVIAPDFDFRGEGRGNGNILILGNSGEGKSYLAKMLATNLRETGHRILILDAEGEYEALTRNLGGRVLDMAGGEAVINPLEVRVFPAEGKQLSAHLSFLRDFFRCAHAFTDGELDVLEAAASEVYAKRGLTDETEFAELPPEAYPCVSDLYETLVMAYRAGETERRFFASPELVRGVCLALKSMADGAMGAFFSGKTHLPEGNEVLCFSVRGLTESGEALRDAFLFNLLSYFCSELLLKGKTAALIDELHLFLNNRRSIELLRSAMKRARKKDSSLILASQNVEDFLLPEVRELTKPLFSIPTYQFLFYPGVLDGGEYRDLLEIEAEEYELIRLPARGRCLFRCGPEKYVLCVGCDPYKAERLEKETASFANAENEVRTFEDYERES